MSKQTYIHIVPDQHPQRVGVPLIGIGVLLAITLVLVVVGSRNRSAGLDLISQGASASAGLAQAGASIVAQRELKFLDRVDGGIDVVEPAAGRTLTVIEPGTNGFMRGVLRALARQRAQQGLGGDGAFRLELRSDGLLTIRDLATGEALAVTGFGQTNAGAFIRLVLLREMKP